MSAIYITYAIKADKKTEGELMCEYRVYRARYPDGADITYADFIRYEEDIGEDTYSIGMDDIGYYTDETEAEAAILNNCGDINEEGTYPYAALLKVKAGYPYARSCATERDVKIYRWNDKGGYELVPPSDEEYQGNDLYTLINRKVRENTKEDKEVAT